jgi:hypothetical protein
MHQPPSLRSCKSTLQNWLVRRLRASRGIALFPFFPASKSIAKPSQYALSWHCIPPLARLSMMSTPIDDVHDFTRKEHPAERSAGFQNVSPPLRWAIGRDAGQWAPNAPQPGKIWLRMPLIE